MSAEVAKGAAPRTAASSPTAAEQRNIAPRDLTARTARTVRVDDQAHLHLVKASGPLLIERGAAKGSLPGSALVHMHVGSRVTATFTITTSHGSISGSGSASLKSSGRYTSFGGTLKVSSGTRRYAHAHGSGSLYGVIDRRTHAVTVKTAGSLYY